MQKTTEAIYGSRLITVMCYVGIVLLWSLWSGSVRKARLVEKYIKEMGDLSGVCSLDLESGMFARNLLFFLCQLIHKR